MTDIAVERCCWDIKKFANVDCMIKGCIILLWLMDICMYF
jgi:hypothetical protein